MDFQNKIIELRKIIKSTLDAVITSDYVHIDVPYHNNIGDVLIWEGERDYLNTLPYKCLNTSSLVTWKYIPLDPSVIIILHGGGNFGDLWRRFQEFRLEVIKHYPSNKIVIFPQSVWYDDDSLVAKDKEIMAKHDNLIICARDKYSYDFLKKHFFSNTIKLIPDMAFFISDSKLVKYRPNRSKRTLYFERLDKEISKKISIFNQNMLEIHDWPTIEKMPLYMSIIKTLISINNHLKIKVCNKVLSKFIDKYADIIMRPMIIKCGLKFLSKYNCVITTRLHAMILAILIHRDVCYLDNKSGKLSAYANTWLVDLHNVKPYTTL